MGMLEGRGYQHVYQPAMLYHNDDVTDPVDRVEEGPAILSQWPIVSTSHALTSSLLPNSIVSYIICASRFAEPLATPAQSRQDEPSPSHTPQPSTVALPPQSPAQSGTQSSPESALHVSHRSRRFGPAANAGRWVQTGCVQYP